ncbi:MAG TPA: glycosyltransferase [Thermoanaerobaculia bacterium]|nr:glycosyltransferase [Thermoanaerobaculia bacterium]
MSKPLVSIAMATWNGARYLRQQLDTLYRQTWQNLEVVVSDDASTDGTGEVLAEYATSRGLHYSVNPIRLGLVQNFARAISLCRGELIALSDQDDLWKPHKIETLASKLGEFTLIYCSPLEMLTTGGQVVLDTATRHVAEFARRCGTGSPTRCLMAENWVVSHTVLFRRELVRHALPIPAHQPFHDGWLALVASTLGGIRYLDESLQIYRQHPESLTYIRPHQRRGARRALAAALDGSFRGEWRRHCEFHTARLQDAAALPRLGDDDRAFLAELLAYYGSGLRRGHHWHGFRSGRRIAPFMATLSHRRRRWRFALRALLGGI